MSSGYPHLFKIPLGQKTQMVKMRSCHLLARGTRQRFTNSAITSTRRNTQVGISVKTKVLGANDALPSINRTAADVILDNFVSAGAVIGLGVGPTVDAVISQLKLRDADIKCVPSSTVTAAELLYHGIQVSTADPTIFITDVDCIDTKDAARPFVIGCALPDQLSQPQIVKAAQLVASSSKIIAVVSSNVISGRLHGDLPVIIDADDWEETAEELDDLFLGDAEVWRRSSDVGGLSSPRGGQNPYISCEGHTIIDIRFYEQGFSLDGDSNVQYGQIAEKIDELPGVVTHGLVARGADAVVVLHKNGEVEIMDL